MYSFILLLPLLSSAVAGLGGRFIGETGAKIFTKIGAQRVLYMHEDTRWVCVYKTDKTNAKDAMNDVYVDYWMELPKDFLTSYFKQQKKLLWQEYS